MHSPHDMRSPRRSRGRQVALWVGLSVGGVLPTVGCQVEYAGMTLPSGKYMHDDVQYFPPGPDFPWAATQAATQRARMQQMGLDVAGPAQIAPTGPGGVPQAAGAVPAGNVNQAGLLPNINNQNPGVGKAGAVPAGDAGAAPVANPVPAAPPADPGASPPVGGDLPK